MDSPSPPIRAWAQRLLASETANNPASDTDPSDLLNVFEKMRGGLTQFFGADGLTALMRRALALARREVPSLLQNAKITPDGRLEGIETHAAGATHSDEAATVVTAHLLALLVTFIGEPLTLRLIREVWPEESDRTTTESEDLS